MDTTEKTGPQSIAVSGDDPSGKQQLARNYKAITYREARVIRADPTIAFVRWLVTAPIVASDWSYEANPDAPEGAQELVKTIFNPHRMMLLQSSMNAMIDYGWAGYERVNMVRRDGHIGIKKFKYLLPDITSILVYNEGGYAGLSQYHNDKEVILEPEDTLMLSFESEGDDLYGRALLQNVKKPYDSWEDVEAAAKRYDKKIAGSHLKIAYPKGTSMFEGTETSNFEIAQTLGKLFESSGITIVPAEDTDTGMADAMTDAKGKWSIEIMQAQTAQGSFVERQKYLDAQKARGLGLPERSVFEGQFGTKAEAEAHGDFAITNMELRHAFIVNQVNWHAVNFILRVNYGEQAEDTVWIKPSPLSDANKRFYRDLYKQLMGNPEAVTYELDRIDFQAMRDAIGIPTNNGNQEDDPLGDDKLSLPNAQGIASLLAAVSSKTLAPVVAVRLLRNLGMNQEDAIRMVQETRLLPPPAPPPAFG